MSCEDKEPESNNVVLEYQYIGGFDTPEDLLRTIKEIDGCCGQCAIASILGIKVMDVFEKWGIDLKTFKHHTSQKEMKQILEILGYDSKQRPSPKDKISIPNCDLGIIRVSFGDRNAHWMQIAQNSHYIGIKKFHGRRYIFDNIQEFDGKPINGMWIEFTEYYKLMMAEKMFITSYLEILPNQCGNCGLKHFPKTKCSLQPDIGEWVFKDLNIMEVKARCDVEVNDGIPSKTKVLGILPNEL